LKEIIVKHASTAGSCQTRCDKGTDWPLHDAVLWKPHLAALGGIESHPGVVATGNVFIRSFSRWLFSSFHPFF
jgi:hypothetical protein